MRPKKSRFLIGLSAAAIALGGCSPTPSSAPSTFSVRIHLPKFYVVPAGLATKAPGTLLKSQKLSTAGVDGTTYQVMYVSANEQDQPAAVTGLVFVPRSTPPPGGFPIVSWAHGTNGMADPCTPSLDPEDILSPKILNQLLDHGWEVTATDYQGEGTPPGLLPYLVGDVAARNSVDIVRAARYLPSADAGSTYVVWGLSEGGQTAMFSWQLGPTYGSQSGLHLAGVVADAPPSQFINIDNGLVNSPYRFYLFMILAGFNSAYGNHLAPLQQVLTAKGLSLLPDLRKGCYSSLMSTLDQYSMSQLVKVNPLLVPTWAKLFIANDPESFSTANAVPLLIIQGGDDDQVPVGTTEALDEHLCGVGLDVEFWLYLGQSHTGVVVASAHDMVRWITDRFAGDRGPDPYTPAGQAHIETTACPH
jgi:fermentation-respiration switch protein FrsA (DUF1100 family)